MSPQLDIVSIGTLSCNPFWGERSAVRASHATTTLIRDSDFTLLVDPSLPIEVLAPRLAETTGLQLEKVDAVFLTSFRPIHRRGLTAFSEVPWYLGEQERDLLLERIGTGPNDRATADEVDEEVESELSLLLRTVAAPEKISPNIHLFPSFGVTPGSCSLLVAGTRTIVVAGDAVLTREYFEHGRVFERSSHVEQAKQAFADIVEMADMIVPGHGNIFFR